MIPQSGERGKLDCGTSLPDPETQQGEFRAIATRGKVPRFVVELLGNYWCKKCRLACGNRHVTEFSRSTACGSGLPISILRCVGVEKYRNSGFSALFTAPSTLATRTFATTHAINNYRYSYFAPGDTFAHSGPTTPCHLAPSPAAPSGTQRARPVLGDRAVRRGPLPPPTSRVRHQGAGPPLWEPPDLDRGERSGTGHPPLPPWWCRRSTLHRRR